jgi:acyl-CoA synthetase (NDP forming)
MMDPKHETAAKALRALSSAKSAVVVGGSATPGKMGYTALKALIDNRKSGALFAVNRRADEVMGVPSYPTVEDLPVAVDYAIIALPPEAVPEALASAARRGVSIAQILTSGFGEGTPSGVPYSALIDAISGSELRIMGPNCLGSYVPRAGLSFTPLSSGEPGNMGIISQSGGLGYDFLLAGEEEGLRYSHVLSVGNCVDLDIPDYLAHLREDPDTDAIGMYLESVADGRRLFEELRLTAAMKPVFVLKGGRTAGGAASVESHTGRLAGDFKIWRAMIHQAGASLVESTAELLAGMQAVHVTRPGRPSNGLLSNDPDAGIALIGNGGGATVVACDAAEERDLRLAKVSAATSERLSNLSARTGEIADKNPVDLPLPRLFWEEGRLLGELLVALSEDEHVDGLLLHVNLLPLASRPDPFAALNAALSSLFETNLSSVDELYVVFRSDGSEKVDALRRVARDEVRKNWGVPVFRTMEDAVRGLAAARWQRANRQRLAVEGAPSSEEGVQNA